MNKQDVVDQLKTKISSITFTKKDGSVRTINATLMSSELPPIVESSDKPKKAPNDSVVSVWDVDAKGWKSIIVSNIMSMS